MNQENSTKQSKKKIMIFNNLKEQLNKKIFK